MIANYNLKWIISAVLFIAVIIAGVILHRIGKPYHPVAFNIHKILTVTWIVCMVILLRNQSTASAPIPLFYIPVVVSIAGLLALFISGGLMSFDRMQESMLLLHRVASLALLISVPVIFYSMIWSHSKML